MSRARGSNPSSGTLERDSSAFTPAAATAAAAAAAAAAADPDPNISAYGKREYAPQVPLEADADDYCMAHAHRGKAIIFNHDAFDAGLGLEPRRGTLLDQANLEGALRRLGFRVRVLSNPSRQEVLHKLAQEADNAFHRDSDCLVVAVLSHGEDGGLLHARDAPYAAWQLWAPFLAARCPALAAKPKLFVVQACRGQRLSLGVEINARGLTTDSTKLPDARASDTFSVPNEADVLVAFSTFEGNVAYRDTEEGTWYISELCAELEQNARRDDLLTMLTRVNRRVAIAREADTGKQMPSLQSTLTRKLFFHPPHSPLPLEQRLLEISAKLDALKLPAFLALPPGSHPDSSAWRGLRAGSELPAPSHVAYPAADAALRHAKALKMFLEEHDLLLEGDVKRHGKALLALLSAWEALDEATKAQAHALTASYLRRHAASWPVMQVVDVPDVAEEEEEYAVAPPGALPLVPRSRKTSRSSQASRESGRQPLKARPPFK